MEVGRWVDLGGLVNRPAVMETFVDILLCVVPIWMAVMIGLMIGWSWRPRWTGLVFLGLRSKLNRLVWTAPPGFGARRLWFALTAISAYSVGRRLWNNFRGRSQKPSATDDAEGPTLVVPPSSLVTDSGGDDSIKDLTGTAEWKDVVTEDDLQHFLHLLDGRDGNMAWQSMMERSTSNMTYQAWRHESETGPNGMLLRSKTVFEDATPELVRDFFWDDEFRPRWDPMLAYVKILHECPNTGFMILHWIKKFPFFCSDREYIIGKRIWESGRAYYCVTKGVQYPALPRMDKPRRVDLYFSSWVIRPVESRKGDGQFTACEVTLIHYEDMGIPKDVAKLGVRHGMWGTVKKLHSGFRSYQNARKSDTSAASRCALMAQITTKVSVDEGSSSSMEAVSSEEARTQISAVQQRNNGSGIDWRLLVIGGTVAVMCGLHTGLIGKTLLFGAGQRMARRGQNRR
nr:stAR-related lipid transfer protein 7, mitochondrial-like [Ipomoea batatas]